MGKVHSIHAAKTNLARLIQRATAGEDVVIARGRPRWQKLIPANFDPPRRHFGAMKGRAKVTPANKCVCCSTPFDLVFDDYSVTLIW